MLGTQTVEAKTKYIPVLPSQDDLPYDDAAVRHYSIPPLPTQDDLPSCDGVPMETERHRKQMEILINSLEPWLGERGYVSGNMFVYFSPNQVKNEDFRGPDVFVTLGLSSHERKSWVVWEEGKAPDIVIELLSETTAKEDKGKKKQIYQDKLRVPEYYWFDPFNAQDLAGFELKQSGVYEPIAPDAQNRLVSGSLGLALVHWHGVYGGVEAVWLRWATLKGQLLPTPQEARDIETQRANFAEQRAEQEKEAREIETQRTEQEKEAREIETLRAEQEKQRAERLAQRLRELGIDPDKE